MTLPLIDAPSEAPARRRAQVLGLLRQAAAPMPAADVAEVTGLYLQSADQSAVQSAAEA